MAKESVCLWCVVMETESKVIPGKSPSERDNHVCGGEIYPVQPIYDKKDVWQRMAVNGTTRFCQFLKQTSSHSPIL